MTYWLAPLLLLVFLLGMFTGFGLLAWGLFGPVDPVHDLDAEDELMGGR